MIHVKLSNTARAVLLIILPFLLFAGCKKDAGAAAGPVVSPEFYLSATIDGKEWTANLKNGDNNVAAGTSGGFMFVVGAQAAGKDTTALVLVFPAVPQLNTKKAFDPLQKSNAGYVTTANNFSADPSVKGSGNYVITSLNDSSKVVEGTFSFKGMLTEGLGATSVNISNGKFKTAFRINQTPQPPDNLKR